MLESYMLEANPSSTTTITLLDEHWIEIIDMLSSVLCIGLGGQGWIEDKPKKFLERAIEALDSEMAKKHSLETEEGVSV